MVRQSNSRDEDDDDDDDDDAVSIESELHQLAHWPQVAIAARMALRLAPVFGPPENLSPFEFLETPLLAYFAAAALSARAARDGSPASRDLLDPALSALSESSALSAPGSSKAAAVVQAAALGAGGLSSAPLRFPPFQGSLAAEAEDALQEDLQALSSLTSATSMPGAVPEAFWERPLWPNPKGDWNQTLPAWQKLLTGLNLSPVFASYVYLATTPASPWKDLDALIGLWSSHLAAANPPTPATAAPKTAPKPPASGRPRLQMLADRALDDDSGDRLDFKPYADAIAGLIDNPETGTPLTIAIHGPWGAGKSTLAGMIKRRLERKPAAGGNDPHVTCWFNAWMHDDATDLAAAFAAELARTADRLRPLWRRLLRPLPSAIRPPGERLRRRTLLWGSALLTAAVVTYVFAYRRNLNLVPLTAFVDALLKAFNVKEAPGADGGLVLNSAFFSLMTGILLLIPHLTTVARSLSEFVRDPKSPASTGSMDRVRTQLGDLIQEATPVGSRFVVFVDDLERCRPPRSVDVLEVVNQLLSHPEVVVVVMADMTAVAACAEIKYEKLASLYSPEAGGPVQGRNGCTYGRMYLQKIIQLQFNLPELRPEKIRGFLDDLAQLASVPASAGGAAPTPAKAAPPRRPSLVQSVRRGWQSPYFSGIRQAAVRKPWPLAVALTPREVLVFPTFSLTLLMTRLGYPPSTQKIQARPGSLANHWRLDREIADGLYRPFLAAALCSWLVLYLPAEGSAKSFPNLTGWFWASLLVTASLAALRIALVRRRVAGSLADPAYRTPRLQRWARWLAVGGLTLGLTLLAWLGAALPLVRSFPRFSLPVYLILALLCTGLTSLFAWLEARAQRREDLEEMRKVRDLTRASIQNGVLEPADLVKALADIHLVRGQEDLIAEALQIHFFNESDLLREAETEMMPFLPPLPRNAKRILNHLRLMLFIATARKVFGGQPEISPRHFGKWIVLQERWPEVARAVVESPAEMAELERLAADPKKFARRIAGIAPWYARDADLRGYCAADTKLGEVVERLLHFDLGVPLVEAPLAPRSA